MAHAQHIAQALNDERWLFAFVTTFAWNRNGPGARALARLPEWLFGSVLRQLERRSISSISNELIHTYPSWELLRTFCQKVIKNDVIEDMVWDRMMYKLDRIVARAYVPKVNIIHAFEYNALASFKMASELGVARVLHVPSIDNRLFREILKQEKLRWPDLCKPEDQYFERKFEYRQKRREAEIELADIIITNSKLTAGSHIAAGADARKVFSIQLGAPLPVDEISLRDWSTRKPLKFVWAGPFSVRKGAHYLLEAWSRLRAGSAAQLNVFGQIAIPKSFNLLDQPHLRFHGSVAQHELFAAFLDADVLVFPTLSDGFGMVVAEAFAHGLPVITTNAAGASELVSSENGLIVPPADPIALANALSWCLDNRQRLQNMRLAALSTARDRQWAHFRTDLTDLLRRTIL